MVYIGYDCLQKLLLYQHRVYTDVVNPCSLVTKEFRRINISTHRLTHCFPFCNAELSTYNYTDDIGHRLPKICMCV